MFFFQRTKGSSLSILILMDLSLGLLPLIVVSLFKDVFQGPNQLLGISLTCVTGRGNAQTTIAITSIAYKQGLGSEETVFEKLPCGNSNNGINGPPSR
jgi:hypothetical protein